MSTYKIAKKFENFTPGDEVILNPRQAKYRLLSGHIVEVETKQSTAKTGAVDTAAEALAVDKAAFADDGAVKAAAAKAVKK